MNWPALPFRRWLAANPLPQAPECPPTQAVHHKRRGAFVETTKRLQAEVAAATGKTYPALEKITQ